MRPIDKVLSQLSDAKRSGKGYIARCPAHDDQQPSLSVREKPDGMVLLKCHAKCRTESVCEAIGLGLADLFPKEGNGMSQQTNAAGNGRASATATNGHRRIVATYDYLDADGNLVHQTVRYAPKDFHQRRPKPGGGWIWNLEGVSTVLYRLPELIAADPAKTVFIAEGEKDADRLRTHGLVATCNAGGAGKWRAEFAEFFRDRIVVILPHNDDPGERHATTVARSLLGIAASIKVVELPELPEHGDVSDWLDAGGTADGLQRMADEKPEWFPDELADATVLDGGDWPEIVPFDANNRPPFPIAAMPPALGNWVDAESNATQTPPDLAGSLALATVAATIARRVGVEARPGFREPTNIFVAVLLEPGNRKSAVFTDAVCPLLQIETELIESARPEVARAQSERRQAESRLKKLEKLAGEKGDAEARYEAQTLAAELATMPEPALPRLLVDDATGEKLGMILSEQGGRIASMSAEGGVFDHMAGLYSKSGLPQFDVYLKGHAGDTLITDRVSRKSVRVDRPALTCAYAIQPAVIEGVAKNPAFRGRGLLGRFLYSAPLSRIGHREIAPAPVPDRVRADYDSVLRRLVGRSGRTADNPTILRLDAAAAANFTEWEGEVEAMLADGGEMEGIRDWGAKLAGATLRIAAVLHCVEHGPLGGIGEATITAAVEIARYYIPHARYVLSRIQAQENSTNDDAQYVLRWIERHSLGAFTKRDVHQHGKRRFPKVDAIDPVLAELVRRGYIRPQQTDASGPGRPPSPAYEVNPAFLARKSVAGRSQYSQNPEHEAQGIDIENYENTSDEFAKSLCETDRCDGNRTINMPEVAKYYEECGPRDADAVEDDCREFHIESAACSTDVEGDKEWEF